MVTEHGVRFYCGTPLIGSSGHRLGSLSFVDDKPRKMEAHNCLILSNLCALLLTSPHQRVKRHRKNCCALLNTLLNENDSMDHLMRDYDFKYLAECSDTVPWNT